MIDRRRIEENIIVAAQFLAATQIETGGFVSLSSATEDFAQTIQYRTTFLPSLILGAIAVSDAPVLAPVKQNITDFLLQQQSPFSSLNYWDRQSEQFATLPYPDDLDDTFAAWGALASFDPALVNGEVLAHLVELLTAQEVQPGGPYRTWLVTKDADTVWQDIDLAVNSNIAWFLQQQKVVLPDLTRFIEDRILQQKYLSPYYPNSYPLVYFASRAYRGNSTNKIGDYLLRNQSGDNWDNPLNTALAVSSLLRLGASTSQVTSAVDYLLDAIQQDGFKPYQFCFDPSINKQKYVAGAASLTAALILEALTLYLQSEGIPTLISDDQTGKKIYTAVQQKVEQDFFLLPEPLRTLAAETLNQTLRRDTDQQIVLLPYWFAQAVEYEPANQDLLINLGAANLYGWIAYTIYDNIIDDAAQISLLPLANVCLRQVISVYDRVGPSFRPIFHTVMDRMEAANAWEITNTRCQVQQRKLILPPVLPDYVLHDVLAEKSLGHTLGPLAVLHNLGFDAQSPEMIKLQELLKHYLIARQLNDDAHDWQEDLQQGQLNSVAVLILKQALGQGLVSKLSLDLNHDLPKLQELFWHELIQEVSELIMHHVVQARELGQGLKIIKNKSFLDMLLMPLEQAANQARTEAGRAKEFISTYNQPSKLL